MTITIMKIILFFAFLFSFNSVSAINVTYLNPQTNWNITGNVPWNWANDIETAEEFCSNNLSIYVSHIISNNQTNQTISIRNYNNTLWETTNYWFTFSEIICDDLSVWTWTWTWTWTTPTIDFTQTNSLLINIENKINYLIDLFTYFLLLVIFVYTSKLFYWFFTKLYYIYPFFKNLNK